MMRIVLGRLPVTKYQVALFSPRFFSSTVSRTHLQDEYSRLVADGTLQKDERQLEVLAELDVLRYDLLTEVPVKKQASVRAPVAKPQAAPVAEKSGFFSSFFNKNASLAPTTTVASNFASKPSGVSFNIPEGTLKGVYLYGTVGTGKTFLMDMFYTSLEGTNITRTRKHFHQFMLQDVHMRIHKWRQSGQRGDPIDPCALEIAKGNKVICFDEMAVTDVADALILNRLFHTIMAQGTLLITTSNRAPEDLYLGGINRHVFLPFIDLINKQCLVRNINHGKQAATSTVDPTAQPDWGDVAAEEAKKAANVAPTIAPKDYRKETVILPDIILSPCSSMENKIKIHQWFNHLANPSPNASKSFTPPKFEKTTSLPAIKTSPERLDVMMGRHIDVLRGSVGPDGEVNHNVCLFTFDELCKEMLGAADYTTLCRTYRAMILTDIPVLTANNHTEARRFITLIDALYDNNVMVIASTEKTVDELFNHFTVMLSDSRFDTDKMACSNGADEALDFNAYESPMSKKTNEMGNVIAALKKTPEGVKELNVSRAALSGIRDVAFAFARANSRLKEMQGKTYLERTKYNGTASAW